MYVVKLHQFLLPPSDVSQPLDSAFVDEQYAQQLASHDGLECLRLNWFVLLSLLFPCGGCPSEGGHGNEADTARDPTRSLTEDERQARNEATAPLAIREHEALDAGPLAPCENAMMRDPGTLDRVYFSFVVFLRFFGWRMHDEQRGVLDRHRGWQQRYALLAAGATQQTDPAHRGRPTHHSGEAESCASPAPSYDGSFNFYASCIPRMLSSLLSVGFVLFAIRLLDFLLEEMKASRLLALLPMLEAEWLPLLAAHEAVDRSHVKRQRKAIYRLTHSDSD